MRIERESFGKKKRKKKENSLGADERADSDACSTVETERDLVQYNSSSSSIIVLTWCVGGGGGRQHTRLDERVHIGVNLFARHLITAVAWADGNETKCVGLVTSRRVEWAYLRRQQTMQQGETKLHPDDTRKLENHLLVRRKTIDFRRNKSLQ